VSPEEELVEPFWFVEETWKFQGVGHIKHHLYTQPHHCVIQVFGVFPTSPKQDAVGELDQAA